VAPPPRPTERLMAQVQRFLASRRWKSHLEINRLLSSPEGQRALASVPPRSRMEKAQEKAFDAWEADGEDRYRLAREALALDERCSDAWLILAERERTWVKQRKCFEKAVALSSRGASDEGWLESHKKETVAGGEGDPAGGLYGSVVARPFLRARMALARCLMDGGHFDESRALYEELMNWDGDDHLGVRFEVLHIYHEKNDLQALARLVRRYAVDVTACLAYERLWLALARGAAPRTVARLEKVALRANPHVPAYLSGRRQPHVDLGRTAFVIGGEDEAVDYARMAIVWWAGLPEAWDWLKAADAKDSGVR